MLNVRRWAESGFIPAGGSVRQRDSEKPAPAQTADRLPANPVLRGLIIAVSAAGVGLALAGVLVPDKLDWQVILVLAALAVIAERTDLSLYGDSSVSLAFVPMFAAVLLSGLTGLAIVVACAMLASSFGRPLYKTAFNYGTLMVAGAASLLVFNAFGVHGESQNWGRMIWVVLVAGGVNFLVNSTLVATAIAISSRRGLRSIWAEHFIWLWPHYLVLAAPALAMVVAYHSIGIWGIAAFIAPPAMMRFSMKQYLDRTTQSVLELRATQEKLQETNDQLKSALFGLEHAYDGTLRSLVAALDARDSETAGHSDRVADLTMAIAQEMGMEEGSDEWRHLAWGALLHDVGKIAIPDGILRKPGALTDAEWQTMRTHPAAGFEILRTIDFLAPAAEIVLAHHERFDGGGYPRGLTGEEIPLGARVFMIADAFDAMTCKRTYRDAMPPEEALAEILRNSDTQFDPAAVQAFLAVYRKRFVGDDGRGAHSRGRKTTEPSESLKQAIMEAAGVDS